MPLGEGNNHLVQATKNGVCSNQVNVDTRRTSMNRQAQGLATTKMFTLLADIDELITICQEDTECIEQRTDTISLLSSSSLVARV